MKVVDAHQHLWEIERFRYSWCERIPELNRSFTMTDYETQAVGTGIERTLFVEADVDEQFLTDEAGYALAMAADERQSPISVAGVVASVRPESKDFLRQVEAIAGHEKLKGVRRILHTEPDDLSTGELFRDHLKLLASYNLSFDICVLDRQLPVAIALIDSCPGVSFILDHAGNPQMGDLHLERWRQNLTRLAQRENVACKISGLVPRSGTLPSEDHFRQIVEHIIESFGWDRVMFGSDWPLCTLTSSLLGWVDLLKELTDQFGEENQRKLFSENAERIYRC